MEIVFGAQLVITILALQKSNFNDTCAGSRGASEKRCGLRDVTSYTVQRRVVEQRVNGVLPHLHQDTLSYDIPTINVDISQSDGKKKPKFIRVITIYYNKSAAR